MKFHNVLKVLVLLILSSLWLIPLTPAPLSTAAQASSNLQTAAPLLQVWNPTLHSSNVTDLSLAPGTRFTVDVNITNAGPIGGFDITLEYGISRLLTSVITTSTNAISLSPGLFDGSKCPVLVARKEVTPAPFYKLRLAAVIRGNCMIQGTGTLFSVTFNVTGTGAGSIDVMLARQGVKEKLVITGPPDFGAVQNLHVMGAYFRNKSGTPPVPQFNYTPPPLSLGQNVTFDASQSFDPENSNRPGGGIASYAWDWGDGSGNQQPYTGIHLDHIFRYNSLQAAPGVFEVRLVVVDLDDGLAMRQIELVQIGPSLDHDISVAVQTDKIQYNVGDSVHIRVAVFNKGSFQERASLNVTYDSPGAVLIGQNASFILPPNNSTATFNYTLNTSNLSGRVYTLSANAQLLNATDANPSDNLATVSVLVQAPIHDVGILYVNAPSQIIAGQDSQIYVYLRNTGAQGETVSVAAFYDTNLISNQTGVLVDQYSYSVQVIIDWKTTAVPPGNYTLSAKVYLPGDPTPLDNTFVWGIVQVFPAPVISLTPSSGPLGTRVVVHGSNFRNLGGYQPTIVLADVTFDDQFLGYAVIRNGSFDFTFDVPHAQPGLHFVKVISLFYPYNVAVKKPFQVLSEHGPSSSLEISVEGGQLYFPGDTVVSYILAKSDGAPADPTTLQVVLIRPDGTNVTLKAVSVGPGVFKVSYAISRVGPLGTYLLIVNGQRTGMTNGGSIATFQVKPSWIAGNGPQIATVVGIAGLVGTLGLAWQKDYLRRNEEE